MIKCDVVSLVLLVGLLTPVANSSDVAEVTTPPSWEVLPVPRCVDYGSPASVITVGRVAIVRRDAGPYQTVRDAAGELVDRSTVIEEELIQVLKDSGVEHITSLGDNLPSYDGYDVLILLGNPQHNTQTAKYFEAIKLSFADWDDPNTPEDDFTEWKDLGREGYILKAGTRRAGT